MCTAALLSRSVMLQFLIRFLSFLVFPHPLWHSITRHLGCGFRRWCFTGKSHFHWNLLWFSRCVCICLVYASENEEKEVERESTEETMCTSAVAWVREKSSVHCVGVRKYNVEKSKKFEFIILLGLLLLLLQWEKGEKVCFLHWCSYAHTPATCQKCLVPTHTRQTHSVPSHTKATINLADLTAV